MNLRPQGIALLLMLSVSAHAALAPDLPSPVHPPRPVQVIAPGGMALQSPPFSRPALLQCLEDGLEWARAEVRRSRDGHPFLAPERVFPPTDPLRLSAVRDLDASTLRHAHLQGDFAPSRRVPLLELHEALQLVRGRLNLILDCPEADFPSILHEIRTAGLQRQVLLHVPLEHLAARRAQAGTEFALRAAWRPSRTPEEWHHAGRADAVEIPARDLTPDVVRRFHALGVAVHATLASPDPLPEDWDRLLAAGVNAVETTVPEEFLAHAIRQRLPDRKWPVLVSLHRGAGRYAPENTLPAFTKASRLYADFVEFDVRTSREGGLFLLHDRSLDRTTTGHGPIAEAPSSHVASLDAGAWFAPAFLGLPLPTLDRFLETTPRHLQLYLDAKDVAPERLVQSLAKHGWTDRTVVYQSEEYLQRLRLLEPGLRRLAPLRRADDLARLAQSLQPYAVDAAWKLLSRDLIADCHARGILVFSDALDENESIDRYREAIDWGIDLIQTDHPLRLYRAFELALAPASSTPRP